MPRLATRHVHIPTKDIPSWIFDDPKYDQNKPMYINIENPSESLSLNQARTLVRQLVAGFRKAGLQKGDTVCIASFNNIYYSTLFLGILASGGVFTGTNPGSTPRELEHHLHASNVKFLITEPELLANFQKARHAIPNSRILIFDTQNQAIPAGHQSWRTLLSHGEQDWLRFDDLETCRTTNAGLLFSSGTTGLPKAVMISHHNLIAEHTLAWEAFPKPYAQSRVLALPFFHAATLPVAHTTTLKQGTTGFVMRRFDARMYVEGVERWGVTDLLVMGPHLIAILMCGLDLKKKLRSVKHALCGGTPLDKSLQARFQTFLPPDTPFTQVYGMTESSCIISAVPYPGKDDTGSIGEFLPNIDVKLVDDDGKDITDSGKPGEVCFRGPSVTRGYYQNPEANARDWDEDGYFHSGDVAYRDGKTGKWYIVDRKKELIKVRGFQVPPGELEGILLGHPLITDAAVIGLPDEGISGELPRAYVVLRKTKEAESLTPEQVIEWFNPQVSKYKRLDGGVKFIDAIPKTGSGKMLKRLLRETAVKEVKDEKTKAKL